MEQQNMVSSLASIHANSLIWTDSDGDSLHDSSDPSIYGLEKVTQCLKNPLVLAHIKPNYGSLGEFMGDVDITKDLLLHKKRKNDQPDENDQKKVRQSLKKKDLDKVLRSSNSTPFEKSIASKIIIEALFEKQFEMTLQNFSNQSFKPQNGNGVVFNIQTLEKILDEVIEQPKSEHKQIRKNDSIVKQSLNLKKNTQFSHHNLLSLNLKEQSLLLTNLKNKYRSLQKYSVNSDEKLIAESDFFKIQTDQSAKTQMMSSLKQLCFENRSLTFPILCESLRQIDIVKVQSLKIVCSTLTDDLLCFLLDVFSKRGYSLKLLHLQGLALQNTDKVCLKIKQLIEETQVKQLILSKMQIKSKDFCLICLGIGAKKDFKRVSMQNNEISEVAIKCLDILLKFFKELCIDLSGNPIQKLMNSPAYQRVNISK